MDWTHLDVQAPSDGVAFYRKCGFSIESLGEKYPGTERSRAVKRLADSMDRDTANAV